MLNKTFTMFKALWRFHHQIARNKVAAGDTVIDATCGRCHDTLLLAMLVAGRVKSMLLIFKRKPLFPAGSGLPPKACWIEWSLSRTTTAW